MQVIGGTRHLDDIEARRKLGERWMGREQGAGGTDNARALAAGDARGGAAEAVGCAVADLDNRERAAIHGDQVEFAAFRGEIRRKNPVPKALEVARRGHLGRAAEREMRRDAHVAGGAGAGSAQGTAFPFTTCAQSSSRRTRPCASTASRPVAPASGPRLPLRIRGSSPTSR